MTTLLLYSLGLWIEFAQFPDMGSCVDAGQEIIERHRVESYVCCDAERCE